MIIPTTEQKIAIYRIAMEKIQADIENTRTDMGGFCYYITHASTNVTGNRDYPYFTLGRRKAESRECFPELFKHEPKKLVRGHSSYSEANFWFNTNRKQGALKRVKILEAEIKLLQEVILPMEDLNLDKS